MHRVITLMLAMAVLLGMESPATAHSTKGRVKILLTKDTVTADDMAYYIEYWVHNEKYKKKYEHVRNRFFVKEFRKVEQDGGKAEVFFTVLDFRKKVDFDDSMSFVKSPNGIWSHVNDDGTKIAAVYTYVPKFEYYFRKVAMPGFFTGLMLTGSILAFRTIRKKSRGKS